MRYLNTPNDSCGDNCYEQLGIDPEEAFGYHIIEPLIRLRKDGVRKVGEALGLPAEAFDRIPFPGPALAARVIGEITLERIETVRKATVVVERLLKDTGAFQYMAILHEDRVTGMRDGLRDFGQQIECVAGRVSTRGSQHRHRFLSKSSRNSPARLSAMCQASSVSRTT